MALGLALKEPSRKAHVMRNEMHLSNKLAQDLPSSNDRFAIWIEFHRRRANKLYLLNLPVEVISTNCHLVAHRVGKGSDPLVCVEAALGACRKRICNI